MTYLIEKFVKTYAVSRWSRIEYMRANSAKFQENALAKILYESGSCSYLQELGINRKSKRSDFLNRVPLTSYEDLEPFIQRMIAGERSLLSSGQVKWYAKSSGTEGAKSKFIPVAIVHSPELINLPILPPFLFKRPNSKPRFRPHTVSSRALPLWPLTI